MASFLAVHDLDIDVKPDDLLDLLAILGAVFLYCANGCNRSHGCARRSELGIDRRMERLVYGG